MENETNSTPEVDTTTSINLNKDVETETIADSPSQEETPTPNKDKKKSAPVIIVVLLLVLGVGGYLFYTNLTTKNIGMILTNTAETYKNQSANVASTNSILSSGQTILNDAFVVSLEESFFVPGFSIGYNQASETIDFTDADSDYTVENHTFIVNSTGISLTEGYSELNKELSAIDKELNTEIYNLLKDSETSIDKSETEGVDYDFHYTINKSDLMSIIDKNFKSRQAFADKLTEQINVSEDYISAGENTEVFDTMLNIYMNQHNLSDENGYNLAYDYISSLQGDTINLTISTTDKLVKSVSLNFTDNSSRPIGFSMSVSDVQNFMDELTTVISIANVELNFVTDTEFTAESWKGSFTTSVMGQSTQSSFDWDLTKPEENLVFNIYDREITTTLSGNATDGLTFTFMGFNFTLKTAN